ncbi:MAG: serine protease [Gammaproteobacteria bacterium]|nr:serine protease [Gammaproteobacteria bacterium]
MLTAGRSFALSILIVLLGGRALADTVGPPPRPAAARSSARADTSRQVLVTFTDEREGRVPVGELTGAYRKRGEYSNSTWSERRAAELAEDYGLLQRAQWPITALGVHCVVYEVPATQSVDRLLHELGEDQRVESAQSMHSFHVMSDAAQGGSGDADPYLRMQAGLRSMRAEKVHRYATGRNVAIVVIDTGADDAHPELRGHVTSTESFVPASRDTASDIHGTAVSGIIAAAAGNGEGIVGIAPGANLRVMKACWQSGTRTPDAQCNTFTLALALNTAIDARPQIINMSLNGPVDPLLRRLIAKALSEGIIVVASEADTPGPDNEFPASIPGVIAVRTASERTSRSAHPKASVPAPGTEILTTVPHDAYGFMTGSSFAAAHVSGLIALLLELNPDLGGEQVGALLSASEMKTGAARVSCIDACDAVARLMERPGVCAPVHPHAGAAPGESARL